METITKEEAWKLNLLETVREHRAKCDRNCSVSLYLLMVMAEEAGVKFSKEEKELFW